MGDFWIYQGFLTRDIQVLGYFGLFGYWLSFWSIYGIIRES